MTKTEYKSFGYFFLNKRLHPPFPDSYRVSIILLIINKNKSENNNKFLIVQHAGGIWGLPKEGVRSKITIEDLYSTISRNLELELGFRGIKVVETKPLFNQVGLLFDFDRQDYDPIRSVQEKARGRPIKGKIYLLAIMKYQGPDKIPLVASQEVIDFQWVNENEWVKYHESNIKRAKKNNMSLKTSKFAGYLVGKSVKAYRYIEEVLGQKFEKENTLF